MPEQKHQHYVPQFHLRKFLTDPGDRNCKFWVYPMDGGDPRRQTPKTTAAEQDYYTLTRPDGTKDRYLERGFSKVESKAKPIVDKLIADPASLTDEDQFNLAEYFAFQHMRVPRSMSAIQELAHAFGLAMLDDAGNNEDLLRQRFESFKPEGRSLTFEQLADGLRNHRQHIRLLVPKNFQMALVLQVTHSIAEQLFHMQWQLFQAPTDEFFITSDTAVVAFAPGSQPGMWIPGAGFGVPGAQISIPLSKDTCLYITGPYRGKPGATSATRRQVHELNKRVPLVAHRFVISPYKTSGIHEIVRKAIPKRLTRGIDEAEVARLYQAGKI